MDLFLSFLGQMLIYGLVAVFLENSLLSRAMGSSTAVWLMRDHRRPDPLSARNEASAQRRVVTTG